MEPASGELCWICGGCGAPLAITSTASGASSSGIASTTVCVAARCVCARQRHSPLFVGCRQSGNANGSTSLNPSGWKHTGVCAGARNTFRRAMCLQGDWFYRLFACPRVRRLFVLAAAATLVGAVPWNAPEEAAPVGDGSAIAEALDLPLGHQIASNRNQSQER